MTDNLSLPRVVTGVVTRHESYGFHIDIGEENEGVIVITMITDDGDAPRPDYPDVGRTIKAVLLGYTQIGNQPRLSTRKSDFAGIHKMD